MRRFDEEVARLRFTTFWESDYENSQIYSSRRCDNVERIIDGGRCLSGAG